MEEEKNLDCKEETSTNLENNITTSSKKPTKAMTVERKEKVIELIKTNDYDLEDLICEINKWLKFNNRNEIKKRAIQSILSTIDTEFEVIDNGFYENGDKKLKRVYRISNNADDEEESVFLREKKNELKALANNSVKKVDVFSSLKVKELVENISDFKLFEIYVLFHNYTYKSAIVDLLFEIYENKIYLITEGVGGIIIHIRPLKGKKDTIQEIITLLS